MLDIYLLQKTKIFSQEKEIGFVTSGTMSPSLNKAIGIGYVLKESFSVDTEFEVDIRGSYRRGRVVKTPFYCRDWNLKIYFFLGV